MNKFIAVLFAAGAWGLASGCVAPQAAGYKPTFSSFDLPADHPPQTLMASGTMNFQGVPVDEVLQIYEKLSGRTIIRGRLPDGRITLSMRTPLSRVQALQLLDTALAQNGIAMVLSGANAVKAVPANQVASESPPNITVAWELLPESSSCMTRTVQLKHLRAVEAVPILMPFTKLPNSIIVIQNRNLLILRDYSSNIRAQLQLLEKLDRK
jgi:type II secretory pathway component GspD/PulD (secretin)